MTRLQLAIDQTNMFDVFELLYLTNNYIDIIELGTPCIKYNGIDIVKRVVDAFPNHYVLADLKTMDAGEYEAYPFYEAGADICTVLGCADLQTVKGVCNASKLCGMNDVQVDLINVKDISSTIYSVVGAGATIIGIHTGIDQQAQGETPLKILAEVSSIFSNISLVPKPKLSVAGGINQDTIRQVLVYDPDIVVIGSAITSATYPTEVAEGFFSLIKEHNERNS